MSANHFLTVLAILATIGHAHFTFVRISVNGEWQAPTSYIRNKTTPFEEPFTPDTNYNTRMYNDPTYATDIAASTRCGRDNMAHAADTEVLTINAGDIVEFAHTRLEPYAWTDAMWYNCTDGRGSCNPNRVDGIMDINHQGPVIAHLSKVPDGTDVHNYDGSGEWVKIYTLGLEWWSNQTYPVHWLAYNDQKWPERFVFKVPTQTPAGQYLLRIDEVNTGLEEHNEVYNSTSPAQIYPSCAQIEVVSRYDDALPEGILIPEALSHTSPGMAITASMYGDKTIDESYVYPGGPLWDGESLVQDKPTVDGV